MWTADLDNDVIGSDQRSRKLGQALPGLLDLHRKRNEERDRLKNTQRKAIKAVPYTSNKRERKKTNVTWVKQSTH